MVTTVEGQTLLFDEFAHDAHRATLVRVRADVQHLDAEALGDRFELHLIGT